MLPMNNIEINNSTLRIEGGRGDCNMIVSASKLDAYVSLCRRRLLNRIFHKILLIFILLMTKLSVNHWKILVTFKIYQRGLASLLLIGLD